MSDGILIPGGILDKDPAELPINLAGGASSVTGVLPVANGGTGTSTGSITGTGTLTFTAGGASSNVVLTPTGTGVVTSAAPITSTSTSAATSTAGTTGAIRVPNGGISVAGNAYLQNVVLGAVGGASLSWTGGSTTLFAPSASNLQLTNGSFNDFGRLMWGGSTSSYPSLKRVSTALQVRLADDSAFAPFVASNLSLDKTITAAGTTGDRTINNPIGSVNFAAAATAIVVTNSLVTANSVIVCTLGTNDLTAVLGNVVAAAGSFTINLSAGPTAETRCNFIVLN